MRARVHGRKPPQSVSWLDSHLSEEGTVCPACEQFVKLYKRKLYSTMALALVRVYKYFTSPNASEWLHLPKYLASTTDAWRFAGGDEAKLVYWGFLEALGGAREDDSRRNGFYKITENGVKFIKGEIVVPKYTYIYNQDVWGQSDGTFFPREMTDIHEAFGSRFSYRDLMEGE